jgi:hypothetical protein
LPDNAAIQAELDELGAAIQIKLRNFASNASNELRKVGIDDPDGSIGKLMAQFVVRESFGAFPSVATTEAKAARDARAASLSIRQLHAKLRTLPHGYLSQRHDWESWADDLDEFAAELEFGRKRPSNRPPKIWFRLLIVRLATKWREETGRWPTVTHNSVAGSYGGEFIRAIETLLTVYEQIADAMLEGHRNRDWLPATPQARAKAVERAINKARADYRQNSG